MVDEVQVFLGAAAGTVPLPSNALSVMKIASISFIHEYAAVGHLAEEFSPDQKTVVEEKCAALPGPAAFFEAGTNCWTQDAAEEFLG